MDMYAEGDMLDDDVVSLSHCWLALERRIEKRGLCEPSMNMYAEGGLLDNDVLSLNDC